MFPIIILAGGLATRLYPLTKTIPKSLVPIAGQPFVFHQLRLLRNKGITEVILCVGTMGDQIEACVKDGADFGVHVRYSYDGDVLLGTGGAVKKAAQSVSTPFFVLYGDSYLPIDYQTVQTAFENTRKKALMTVFKNEGQWDQSNVVFKDGKILVYDKSIRAPEMCYIDFGLGLFHPSLFEAYPKNEVLDLATVYQNCLARNELAAYEVFKRFYEIGTLHGVDKMEEYFAHQSLIK